MYYFYFYLYYLYVYVCISVHDVQQTRKVLSNVVLDCFDMQCIWHALDKQTKHIIVGLFSYHGFKGLLIKFHMILYHLTFFTLLH